MTITMQAKNNSSMCADSVRLDKWLWAARFYKTRTLSQDNIELGRVRMNGLRLKSSKEVKVGETLEIIRGEEKFVVVVKALSSKRGGAAVAQQLYEETEESRLERQRISDNRRMVPMPGSDYHGRPTKRDGRKIRRFMAEFNPTKDF